MEVPSREAFVVKPRGDLFGFCTGVTVDNTCFIGILLLDKLDDLGFDISLLKYNLIPQIGTVKGL